MGTQMQRTGHAAGDEQKWVKRGPEYIDTPKDNSQMPM